MFRLLSTFLITLSLTACGGSGLDNTKTSTPEKTATTTTDKPLTSAPNKKTTDTPNKSVTTTESVVETISISPTMAKAHCPSGFSCDMLSVPKDYADADAGKVNVFYGVHKATDTANRIGVLMMNFGGPGSETVQQAGIMVSQLFPKAITAHFDIVALDARGSGYSVYADRLSSCTEDKNCNTLLPKIAPFMGTNTIVKDFDQLRQHLKEDTVSFLGYSYGTAIGAIYAHDYPKNVRALVLDGPIDPSAQNYAQTNVGNAAGADKIATYRLETPVRKANIIKLDKYLRKNDDYVYFVNHGQDQGYHSISTSAMNVLMESLSGDESRVPWSILQHALFNIADNYVNNKFLSYSYAKEDPDKRLRESQRMAQMFKAVTCRDERQPVSAAELSLMTAKFDAASAIYGWRMQERSSMCIDTGIANDPTPDITHMDSVLPASLQVLVIAGQYDPNTPYVWSDAMMQSFGRNASRITVNNLVQHTFSFHNDAKLKQVDNLTTAYLLHPENRIANTQVDYLAADEPVTGHANEPAILAPRVVHPAQQVTSVLNRLHL
ncbi:alpha/beta fold hydrolase [Shewanella intestini]|uniref:Proline iminopeptidase n=1 Tax=Shewanella intestini TaxID=2017544 RepID=A0ABS5I1T0_9GAMM|nr:MULTISPECIES: alpha/beta fold hydrolase [Shewanella]MBR9727959.1 alpha/beta hydrolase [Shewanella intestini]MRG36490.1 alpha/beta fold hydrolase [Shewanella sp. XMDDZSB0408]